MFELEKIACDVSADEAKTTPGIAFFNHDQNELRLAGFNSFSESSKSLKQINQTDKNPAKPEKLTADNDDNFIPSAENVDFVEKGKILIRVMDNHNFYEVQSMPDDELLENSTGVLTKLWIYISKAVKEV